LGWWFRRGAMYFAYGCVIWNEGARKKTDQKIGGGELPKIALEKKLKSP